jgi:hemerythrin-like metal-binding protein
MAEQLLMRQYAYPLYEAHELEHDRLVEKVHELQRKYRAGETRMTLEIAQSLKAWLLRHIKSTDHALGDFLKQYREPNAG